MYISIPFFSLSLSLSLLSLPLSLSLSLPFSLSLTLFLSLSLSLSPLSLSLLIGINEYHANPNIIGDGNHTLTVRCYYFPDSLSVSGQYDFKLVPAPEIRK